MLEKKLNKKIHFTQEEFESYVVNFVVNGMLALHIVETDYFISYTKSKCYSFSHIIFKDLKEVYIKLATIMFFLSDLTLR